MKKISSLLIAAGIIILCGCAGTSDFSGLSIRMIAQQGLFGAILIAAGYALRQIGGAVSAHSQNRKNFCFEKTKKVLREV